MVDGVTTLPIDEGVGTGGLRRRAGFVLGRRASLAVSVGVAGHTLWASAAPALAYRLYAQEWHLSHTATTGIFAVFPIAVVAMLVGFGGISDQIGRRAAMLLGLGASLIGTVLFAVAPNVYHDYCAATPSDFESVLSPEAPACAGDNRNLIFE